MGYDELCKNVLDSDPTIRFSGVINDKGDLVAGGNKDDTSQLLSSEEIAMSVHYTLQKSENVRNLSHKIGFEKSSITEYDKVTLISIPLSKKELFLISTEPNANYINIIQKTNSLRKNL